MPIQDASSSTAVPWGLATGAGKLNDDDLQAIAAAGSRVIRTTVTWDEIDPNLDGSTADANWTYADWLVSSCNNLILDDGTKGILLIMQLAAAAATAGQMFVQANLVGYAGACHSIATRYDGSSGKYIYIFECGNEPNGGAWHDASKGTITAAQFGAKYAETMIRIYGGDGNFTGMHDINPSLFVMTAGCGGGARDNSTFRSQLGFMQDAYAALTVGGHSYPNGWKGHYDGMGQHPYCYPSAPSQDTSRAWYWMTQCRAEMVAQGEAAIPVVITEVGDPTNQDTDPTGAVQNDAQHQAIAARMQDAATTAAGYGWIKAITWFCWMNKTKDQGTAWSATTAYRVGDLVRDGGITYQCILANTNHEPPNATYWSLPGIKNDNYFGIVYANAVSSQAVHKSYIYPMFKQIADGSSTNPSEGLRAEDIAYGVGFSPNYSDTTALNNQFDRVVDKAAGLGLGYVRCDVQWDWIQPQSGYTGQGPGLNNNFDWTKVNQLVDACDARGLKLLVMFGYGDNWTHPGRTGDDKTGPNRDPGNLMPDAARAAHALVKHIQQRTTQVDAQGNPDCIYAFEWWNEPNTKGFYHDINNLQDPVGYWTAMRGVYTAIKTGQVGNVSSFIRTNLTPAYPNVRVITGGATAFVQAGDFDMVAWIKKAFANGAGSSFDNVALHLYDWLWGPTYGLTNFPVFSTNFPSWQVFGLAGEVRNYLVSKGVTSTVWVTETAASSRPDVTGTDPNTQFHNGGFDGTSGHTPGGGQSVTDKMEISYTDASAFYLAQAAAQAVYQDTNGDKGWFGPTTWYGLDSTIPQLHLSDGSAWNSNYGFWEYDAEHAGAEKKPANWPTTPSPREVVNALANPADTTDPTTAIIQPAPGDPPVHGEVQFLVGVIDKDDAGNDTDHTGWTVKLHRDNRDSHVTDVVIGNMTYGIIGFSNYNLQFDTTSIPDGTYQFWSTAQDAAGNRGRSAYLTVTVTNGGTDQPPTATIATISGSAPVDGQVLSGSVALVIDATDDHAVSSVHLFCDGVDAGAATLGTPPHYTISFNTAGLTAGSHVFEAHVTDNATPTPHVTVSAQAAFTIAGTGTDTDPPTVVLASVKGAAPIENDVYSGTVRVTVTAVDVNSHGTPDPNPTTSLMIDGKQWTASQPTHQSTSPVGSPTHPTGQTWVPVFTDEFDTPSLDTTKWTSAAPWGTGGASYGFNPDTNLMFYTPRGILQANGLLALSAYAEAYTFKGQTLSYQSGCVSTFGLKNFDVVSTPTYFEASFMLPYAAGAGGLWPGFWVLQQGPPGPNQFPWPPEVDFFEFFGTKDTPQAHFHTTGGDLNISENYGTQDCSSALHTIGVMVSAGAITGYLDGVQKWTFTNASEIVRAIGDNMYILLNLALDTTVAGSLAGTTFPSTMLFDYVRAFQGSIGGSPPSTWVWDVDTTLLDDSQPHTIRGRSTDAAGNVGRSTQYDFQTSNGATNSPPTVTLDAITLLDVSPQVTDSTPDGMTVGGNIDVNATATDDIDTSVSTQLIVDGVPNKLGESAGQVNKYVVHLDTTTLSNGTHTFQIMAVDSSGAQGFSSTITVLVQNAPTVLVQTPQDGQEVSGFVTFNVKANAGGSVSLWEGDPAQTYLADFVEKTPGEFQLVFDTKKLLNGPHVLSVKETVQ